MRVGLRPEILGPFGTPGGVVDVSWGMRQCGSFVVCCGTVPFAKVTCFLDDGLVMWKPLQNSSLASWSCIVWRAPQNGHKAATVNLMSLVARADSVEWLLVNVTHF